MTPSELTVDMVREELASLITRYPHRRGSVKVDDGYDEDYPCVYYTDGEGVPVTANTYDPIYDEPQLVTPVCIIGQWIEDFHPEFKEDELISEILYRNRTIRTLCKGEHPFDAEVLELLAAAQDVQDLGHTCWSDIKL